MDLVGFGYHRGSISMLSICIIILNSLTDKARSKEIEQVVTNFTCLRMNWDKASLKCTWGLSDRYSDPHRYNASVRWYMSGIFESVGTSTCPLLTTSSCEWTWLDRQYNIDFEGEMTIILSVIDLTNNKTVANKQFEVDLDDSVRPEAVQDLKSELDLNNCIVVEWKHPIFWKKKVYRIRFQEKDQKASEIITEQENYTKCDLKYNTMYIISIECKPKTNGLWSESMETSMNTSKHVPSRPPVIPCGSFTLSSFNNQHRGQATIYWTNIDEKSWNGDVLFYQVRIVTYPLCLSKVLQKELKYPEITFDIDSPCGYIAYIQSKNEIGLSVNSSLLHIKRSQKGPSLPQNVLLHPINSTPTLRWKATDNEVDFFTVFWCRKVSDNSCKSGVHFKYIYVNVTQLPGLFSADLNLTDFPTKYRFGVSANKADISSGFHWTECSEYHGFLNPPIVDITKDPDKLEVGVSWASSSCTRSFEMIGYRFNYSVKVCNERLCLDPYISRYYNVKQMQILHVKPGRNICVSVYLSYLNRTGPSSPVRCVSEIRNSKDHYENTLFAILVVMCCAGALISLMFFIYFVRRCHKSYTRMMPIDLPYIELRPMSSR